MRYRIFLIVLLFTLFISNSFGQEKKKGYISKNYFGIELALTQTARINACKQNSVYSNVKLDTKNSGNIKFIYIRTFKHLDLTFIGSYYHSIRNLGSSYIDKKRIQYEYNAEFSHAQYYIMIFPSLNITNSLGLYLKPGIGLNLNKVERFKYSSKIATGLDGDYKRVKKLPDLNQTKLSFRYAIDLGIQSIYFDKNLILNLGARYIINSPSQLKKENIYLYSKSIELYFNIILSPKIL